MYTIQFNDGRVLHDIPTGEAKFWLLLSVDFCTCNVYETGGNGYPVVFIW